ncbi:hypothetical protein ACTFIW_000847 [Dictyostelium discoideum]
MYKASLYKATLIGENNWQNIGEMIYEFIVDLIIEQVGKSGILFFPFIMSLFLFVLTLNVMGLVPLSFTVTGQLLVTFTLAITIMIGITIWGFRIHGIKFLKMFVPSGIEPWLLPLLVFIEIMSYVLRPISLAVRLFANMLAGHLLIHIIGVAAIYLMQFYLIGILPWICVIAFMFLELELHFYKHIKIELNTGRMAEWLKRKTVNLLSKRKPILVKLKLIIGAGTASMTPPLGPNLETKELFEVGMALRVILWINVMKAFYFELQMPKISNMLKEYYKAEFEAAKGGKVYIEKERLLKDSFKMAILICTFNKEEKQWEAIEPAYLKMKVLEVLGTCRSSISGADYNNLRQYIIEHNLQLIHLNANKIKKVFINVKTIILNNNMLIIKAPTIEKFNETLEYLKKYEAQLLPLEILITEEEKK